MARQAAVGVYISSMWDIADRVAVQRRAQYGQRQAVVGLWSGIGRSDSQSLTQIRAREKEVEEEKKRRKDSKQSNKQQASAANTASVAQTAMSLVKGSGGIEKPSRKCRKCLVPLRGHKCPHKTKKTQRETGDSTMEGHKCPHLAGRAHQRTDGPTPRGPDNGWGGNDPVNDSD